MAPAYDRRSFLSASTAFGFLQSLPPVSAADAAANPKLVAFEPEIEPLVRVLEDTPRDKVLEEIGNRVKKGTSYRDVLAALFLAGIRNVQPRPVGFKFHAVLVVNAAHLASLAGPDRDRWLPIFWAIDNFKGAQAQNLKEGGWRMKPAGELKLPPSHTAFEAFTHAMDEWDVDAADVAVASLVRTASSHQLFEVFSRYGCRDFRDIGHKAIYVANAFRLLDTIGTQHAEPVLRSLAYALLEHEGDNPSKRDGAPDRSGRRNAELAKKIKGVWQAGRLNAAASSDVLEAVRTGTDAELGDLVVSLVNRGVAPSSIWDGLFLAAGELLMRQPGIIGLHTLTSLNALHYSFQTATGDEQTRKLLLLQAAAFLPQFHERMKTGKLAEIRINKLEPFDGPAPTNAGEVFEKLSKDKLSAARLALAYLQSRPGVERELIDAGRRLIFLKGTDSHDYKFSAAVMEDYTRFTPGLRRQFLAASLFWLKGTSTADSPLVKRIYSALG
jgi:hypothetical protein